MQILNLKLLNFRNYEKLSLDFDSKKNIIIGNNGMGKTNIVEAIYVLALSKSFRGTKDSVLIKNNCDLTRIEGNIKDKFITNYKIIISTDCKNTKIDNNNIKRISDYLSRINIVLFTVDDLKLVKDSPNIRRKLINIELSQFDNEYLKLLNIYNKVLKQRNTYLKKCDNKNNSYLDIINDQLIELGMKIYKIRFEFILKLNSYISKIYKNINNKQLEYIYKSDFDNLNKDELKILYKKDLDRDIYLGSTSRGIHHDDFIFKLDNYNLLDYGSEGEQKNAVIALKMAEIEIFKNEKNTSPILILDDLFSELDNEKIEHILEYINDDIQVFVTTTNIDKLNDKLKNNSKIFIVDNGNVSERMI